LPQAKPPSLMKKLHQQWTFQLTFQQAVRMVQPDSIRERGPPHLPLHSVLLLLPQPRQATFPELALQLAPMQVLELLLGLALKQALPLVRTLRPLGPSQNPTNRP